MKRFKRKLRGVLDLSSGRILLQQALPRDSGGFCKEIQLAVPRSSSSFLVTARAYRNLKSGTFSGNLSSQVF